MKSIAILGTRGIPASHGGFETFAARLAPFLVERGWSVTVYCQTEGRGSAVSDEWMGVRRVHIPVHHEGAVGTMLFDWKCVSHVLSGEPPSVVLTLGYNTAVFCQRFRWNGLVNLINMDGLEWKREKWGLLERVWLWVNERVGCLIGDHLIADHPRIADHLATRVSRNKISTIPYGADSLDRASSDLLRPLDLEFNQFFLVIARPEPENSVLEIIRSFSAERRGMPLVVLGSYSEDVPFQAVVLSSASDEVRFIGAVYDSDLLGALRSGCRAYVHGHKVGGTNPSLVEALGAGSVIIAHDNEFNRWVAGEGAIYFDDDEGCRDAIDRIVSSTIAEQCAMRDASLVRHRSEFLWPLILDKYDRLLMKWACMR